MPLGPVSPMHTLATHPYDGQVLIDLRIGFTWFSALLMRPTPTSEEQVLFDIGPNGGSRTRIQFYIDAEDALVFRVVDKALGVPAQVVASLSNAWVMLALRAVLKSGQ